MMSHARVRVPGAPRRWSEFLGCFRDARTRNDGLKSRMCSVVPSGEHSTSSQAETVPSWLYGRQSPGTS
eukprot:2834077-Rhodomonas_salina.2